MLIFEKFYHIYNHANGHDNLFREQKNYIYFLEKYKFHVGPIAETIAWCLMPNHFHLLIKIKSEEEISSAFPKFGTLEKLEDKLKFLSKQFSNFFSSYSQSYNKMYLRRGSLFLKNFKRKEITDESYLRNLILYIHLNPIKHGFTKNITGWKWTTYSSFPKVNSTLLDFLFDNQKNYQYVHEYSIDSLDSELFNKGIK